MRKPVAIRRYIDKLLAGLSVFVFPTILVAIAGAVLVVRLLQTDSIQPPEIPIHVWMDEGSAATGDHRAVLARLAAVAPTSTLDTRLSTQDFWFTFDLQTQTTSSPTIVDFPSRHLTALSCWDAKTDQVLGSATRVAAEGQIAFSRAGFSLNPPPSETTQTVLCKANFRGPAKLTVRVWPVEGLRNAQAAHRTSGAMIEAGIGILSLFMLMAAWVNRSRLYWTFVAWLLLNMRMASLSAGTDWELFGVGIDPAWIIDIRQWTVSLYSAMTVALFTQLFREELEDIRAGWMLFLLQVLAVVFSIAPVILSFEQTLLAIWPCTAVGTVIIAWYLNRILKLRRSRIAGWYAASIAFAVFASLAEVLAAASGQNIFLNGINHITAAVASAFFASLAMAEHMRADRLERIEAQKMLRAAYDDSPIGLFTVGDKGQLLRTNPAFLSMLEGIGTEQKLSLTDIFDKRPVEAIAQIQSAGIGKAIELQTKVVNPKTFQDHWFSIKASTADGTVVEGTLQDVTERVQANERLEFMVNHDALTDCMNLRGITRRFERTARQPDALAYLDLDRFKLINDLYGHTAGDSVLKQVCERIKHHLGPSDVLARLGGDEFVVAFSEVDMDSATRVCHAIVDDISSTSYKIESQSFSLSVSAGLVGTARFSTAGLKEVISAADTLCRIAKKRSTERLVVMESGDKFFELHKEELELIAALERGETPAGLFLVMQPEISLTAPFDSLNFEVLLRLRKADGQVLPASIIIEAAEAHGKTAIIDRWVVTTTIKWLETHAATLGNTRFVGVNLSGGSLNDLTFTEELFTLFEGHPMALSMICFEITETVALTDMQSMQRFIDRVRHIGGKVALDDFGAGYSSFAYLKGLSVDALKLDGSLVRDAAQSPSGMAIVEAVAGLVTSLGMKSIGEFAENLAVLKVLVAAGVDYAQGYAISKPVMPAQILAARNSTEFIEDQDVLAFIQSLSDGTSETLPLFGDPTYTSAT